MDHGRLNIDTLTTHVSTFPFFLDSFSGFYFFWKLVGVVEYVGVIVALSLMEYQAHTKIRKCDKKINCMKINIVHTKIDK